ncbi:MAG: 4-hydroxy-3-methylbut-2-enyl diphosphate reductase [Candidatus Marinamargulisbacteria bacterium]|jgi:4-hydroxy-3-methylbut-2-enyl diphosphate reductase
MEIHLAATQGFCAGVAMAIDVVDQALKLYGTPLYVRHHIVHNHSVITDFEEKGVIFIENLSEVPSGETIIFSAHGTAPEVYKEAEARNLKIIDATCPLVTKVHRHAMRFSKRNVQTVLIGHKGHQELVGTSGYVDSELLHVIEDESDISSLEIDETRPVAYLTQTTLSVDDTKEIMTGLKKKFPEIQGSKKADICYATQNRQDVVVELAAFCDVVIVCGSSHSSNSNRLKETAKKLGLPSYIIDNHEELDFSWIEGKKKVGITSGASVPRYIVDDVVKKIQERFKVSGVFQDECMEKGIHFKLPRELTKNIKIAEDN